MVVMQELVPVMVVLIALSETPRAAEGFSQEPPRFCPQFVSRHIDVSPEEQDVVPEPSARKKTAGPSRWSATKEARPEPRTTGIGHGQQSSACSTRPIYARTHRHHRH